MAIAPAAGCRRSRVAAGPPGPTPEEQGYLPSDFRAHVEFVTEGAIDWGNHRYLARVSVPVEEKTTAGEPLSPVVAETQAYDAAALAASRVVLTLAAGIRVDARDTLSNLASDEGTLRLWGNVQGRRLLRKRRLRNGDLECLFEVPMLGVGGVVSQLYSRAAKAAAGGASPLSPACRCESASVRRGAAPSPAWGASLLPAGLEVLPGALAAAAGGSWDMVWTLERPKDALLAPAAGSALAGAPVRGGVAVSAKRAAAAEAADRAPSGVSLAEGRVPQRSGPRELEEPAPAIVIDARGTGALAALFPLVMDEAGRVVYSAARARREAVVNEGLVQYVELARRDAASDARAPRISTRACPGVSSDIRPDLGGALGGAPIGLPDGGGEEPAASDTRPRRRRVVLTAKSSEGPLRANIIVSREDAARLEAAGKALDEARVIIVTDTSVGGVEGLLRDPGDTMQVSASLRPSISVQLAACREPSDLGRTASSEPLLASR